MTKQPNAIKSDILCRYDIVIYFFKHNFVQNSGKKVIPFSIDFYIVPTYFSQAIFFDSFTFQSTI